MEQSNKAYLETEFFNNERLQSVIIIESDKRTKLTLDPWSIGDEPIYYSYSVIV